MFQINLVVLGVATSILMVVSTAPTIVNDVKIDSYNYKLLNDQNEYKFNYKLSDGQERTEEGSFHTDKNGELQFVVSGSYQYIGPDNVVYSVSYTADKDGFYPFGAHLPGLGGLILSTPMPPALGIPANALASLIG